MQATFITGKLWRWKSAWRLCIYSTPQQINPYICKTTLYTAFDHYRNNNFPHLPSVHHIFISFHLLPSQHCWFFFWYDLYVVLWSCVRVREREQGCIEKNYSFIPSHDPKCSKCHPQQNFQRRMTCQETTENKCIFLLKITK